MSRATTASTGLRRVLIAATAATTALAALALPAGAQDAPAAASSDDVTIADVDPAAIDTDADVLDPDREIHVVVELAEDSVAEVEAEVGELQQVVRADLSEEIEAEQAPVVDAVADVGGEVEAQLTYAYNGVRARIPASQVAELEAQPGVVAVRPLQTMQRDNQVSNEALGIPSQVWSDLGLDGEGISIGVIDTGIDYLHANFGGAGDPAQYEANDRTIVETGTFPTAKVVGGFDFVGDEYDASGNFGTPDPRPDPDPLDCQGHGTHVAGTAGGYGVLDGATYPGPYDATTAGIDFTRVDDVGPGVAPRADLYALKVFGCDGSTDVTIQAIEWAVQNDLDVINMSLGSPIGRPSDPTAVAATNAAAAGVVVVASAGNSGDIQYVTGSPGSGAGVISVAAEDVAFATVPFATLLGNDLQVSNGAPIPDEGITGRLVVLEDVPDTPDNEALGCNVADFEANGVQAGDIVITFRGACARVARAENGQQLGAAAVVMINNADGFPPFEGRIPGVEIPFLGAPQGAQFDAPQGEVEPQPVTILPGPPRPNDNFERLAPFTSSGPRNGDSGSKPDVTAPGVAVLSADVGTGTGNVRLSGTSMAAPIVAGVTALVRESNPDLTPAQIKAAVVNSGDPDAIRDYTTVFAGSGEVTPRAAIDTEVFATVDDVAASISFGYVSGITRTRQRQTIQVENTGDTRRVFTAAYEPSTELSGVEIDVLTPRIRVQPGATRDVRVLLDVEFDESTYGVVSGNVVLDDGTQTLRVPVMAVVDPTSDVTADVRQRRNGDTLLRLRNRANVVGTAETYRWLLEDPQGDVVGGEDYAPPTSDLRALGYLNAGPIPISPTESSTLGVFAVNAWERGSSPSLTAFDVLVDTDEDGSPDFTVVGVDIGLLIDGSLTGDVVAVTFDNATGGVVGPIFDAVVANDASTVLLPFLPELLGLSPDGDAAARVSITSQSVEGLGRDFAEFGAGVDVEMFAPEPAPFEVLAPRERIVLPVSVPAESDALGWMVVSFTDGATAPEADLVSFAGLTPTEPPVEPPTEPPVIGGALTLTAQCLASDADEPGDLDGVVTVVNTTDLEVTGVTFTDGIEEATPGLSPEPVEAPADAEYAIAGNVTADVTLAESDGVVAVSWPDQGPIIGGSAEADLDAVGPCA